MNCSLTVNPMRSYSRPKPHYPVRGDWYATTTWELADGFYKRMFRSPSTGHIRGAFVERALGGWRWRVQDRSVRGVVTQVAISSIEAIKPLARMCFGAADLAATTK